MRRSAQPAHPAEPEYAGQYRLESVLGSGGMGVVHMASSVSGLRLAVKVVHAEFAADPEFRARFRQEVTAARRVSGAFTAAVVDADPEAERPWMATLFVDGPTLAERVKQKPLEAAELSRLGAGLAEALRDIHRAGLVHRDLKPGNVLMASDGPKVIDFGISRPYDSDLRTETGKLIGTPPFMAPEQFQRPREVGPEADVFAMGAVLVHAATGRGPFDSDSPYLVAYQVVHHEPNLNDVPGELRPIVERCLQKDPAQRPTTDALIAALRSAAYPTSENTRAFIPAPRDPVEARSEEHTHRRARIEVADAEPPSRPRSGATHGSAATPGPGAAPGSEAAPGPRSGGVGGAGGAVARVRRRPTRRVALATGAALVLVGAVAALGVVLTGGQDGGGPPAGPSATVAGTRVRPWTVPLIADGAGDRTPLCSYGGGADAAVYCTGAGGSAARLDPVTGAVRWTVKPSRKAARRDARVVVQWAPEPAGGLVHTVPAGSGRLEALDPRDGAVRWSAPAPTAALLHAGAARETVLLVGQDGDVTALDSATGGRRWSKRLGEVGSEWTAAPGARGPVLVSTLSADGASTTVKAVSPRTGAVLWQRRVDGSLTPVGSTDRALLLLRSDRHAVTDGVVRLDLRTREVRGFTLSLPVDQPQAAIGPDGTVYVIGLTGGLTAVRTEPGPGNSELWRQETAVARTSRPVVDAARHLVYLSAADGRLIGLDSRDGRLVGQSKPRTGSGSHPVTSVVAPPAPADGRVVAGAPDGSVFAVDAGDPADW
ncbi:PQQ-binding-like beta-propeller repeat protein [Streptomyces sp. NRRL S-87]|uniref:serine/threonine-protein kinase n=1 Tax=Streptomyces sp. NRRL S-87 TaxID=1463920 RepID=UPI0004BFF809|nr:serine/threonine-protein kinase [Streptomyces sp. NRRL S-87]